MVKRDLIERVAQAAGRALENQKYVSAADVFASMGMLSPHDLNRWRRGEVPHLEDVIQSGPARLNDTLRLFNGGRKPTS